MPACRVVGVDIGDDSDALADRIGQQTGVCCALLVKAHDLLLQFGNQPSLEWVETDCRQSQHPILHEDECHIDAEQPALEGGCGDDFADEPAQGLDLAQNRLDHFAGFGLAEAGHFEQHHAFEQHEPQTAQHPLTGHADLDVHQPFDAIDRHNHEQEQPAQEQQIWDLFELEAQEFLRKIRARNRLVDDDLGDLKRDVDKRKARHRK